MKLTPQCIPCFFRQALIVANAVGASDEKRLGLMKAVAGVLAERIGPELSPAGLAGPVHAAINSFLGVSDPFARQKKQSNDAMLAMYEDFRALAKQSPDPLDVAVRLSIIGNLIDFSLYEDIRFDSIMDSFRSFEPAVYEYDEFKSRVLDAQRILIVTDNAGECVADMLLAEVLWRLKKKVIVIAKEKPILNDATVDEVRAIGMERFAKVVGVGNGEVGTIQPPDSMFTRAMGSADLVIAKGQANFETLYDADAPVFCLLVVKCGVVADVLKAPERSPVLIRGMHS